MTITLTPSQRTILSRPAVIAAWNRGLPFHRYSLLHGVDEIISKNDTPRLLKEGVTHIEFVYSYMKKNFTHQIKEAL